MTVNDACRGAVQRGITAYFRLDGTDLVGVELLEIVQAAGRCIGVQLCQPLIALISMSDDQLADALMGDMIAHRQADQDRKSTRLNSSHVAISYAVFCLTTK